jgi:drug/metabolite transporter (DMT)-like permease
MASKLKIAGIAIFIIGAILIILSHFLGWNNSNLVNLGSVVLMVAGLVTYIYASKKLLEE